MWTLTSKKSGSVYYLLSEKEKYLVGRVQSDLVLPGDTSISRSHACLYPAQDSVKAIDVGSKYGTFCNENIDNKVPMAKNVAVELKNGERIQFGMLGNEWILSKPNICSLTSTLTAGDKTEMQSIFRALDGRIIDTWIESCTHLTMSEITVTHKVLHALVQNIPIVSMNFWREYLSNLRAGQPPPKPAGYLPRCAESFLNREDVSFGLVAGRKTLFAGKTFVFMSSKPFEKYKSIVCSAGGACENFYTGVQKNILAKKDVIVVRYNLSSQTQSSQTVDSIFDLLKTKGRRSIPDAEIGLAIIHCSTSKYCNPEYNPISEFAAESNDVVSNTNIFAKETPGMKYDNFLENLKSIEVPESAVYDLTENDDKNLEEKVHVILDETENFTKAPDCLIEKDSLVSGKRKRITSESDHQTSKKLNVELRNDSIPVNTNDPMTDQLSDKLIVESSQPTHGPTTSSKQIAATHPSTRTSRINMSGFIKKSQITPSQSTDEQTADNIPSQFETETRKRPRIVAICSDDDEEDLFVFANAASKRTRKDRAGNSKETLFNFGVTAARKTQEKTKDSTQSSQPDIPKKLAALKREFRLPDVKPIVITSDGWLSKSFGSMKVKSEEKAEEKYSPETSSWIDSMKGGFEVRVKSMKLVSASRDLSLDASTLAPVKASGKNFKAFVKQNNYKPQVRVVSTVPVYVGLSTFGGL